jgi:hypothetical protein
MSLPEFPINRLAYIVEAGNWAVVPASQEGESNGKRNFLELEVLHRQVFLQYNAVKVSQTQQ